MVSAVSDGKKYYRIETEAGTIITDAREDYPGCPSYQLTPQDIAFIRAYDPKFGQSAAEGGTDRAEVAESASIS